MSFKVEDNIRDIHVELEGGTFYFSPLGKINFAEISNPKPKDIIFHDPATIIYWSDGTKTVVKCHEEDTYDKEKGLALCYVKKFCGDNTSRGLNDILKLSGEILEKREREIIQELENLPPSRAKGKWLHRNDDYSDWLECSNCGYGSEGEVKLGEDTPYCPYCGAKLEVEI